MDKILEKIKIRLEQFHMTDGQTVFDDEDQNPILEELMDEAWQDVRNCRKYPSTYTEAMITADLEKYKKTVVKLVVYDYNKLGADYESENRESDITRAYEKRESILSDVIPLARVL